MEDAVYILSLSRDCVFSTALESCNLHLVNKTKLLLGQNKKLSTQDRLQNVTP